MKRFKKNKIGLMFAIAIIQFTILTTSIIITGLIAKVMLELGVLKLEHPLGGFKLMIIALVGCLVIGCGISISITPPAMKPVKKIIEEINKLAKGDFSARLDIKNPPELKQLSTSFNAMAEELSSIELLRRDFTNNFSHEFKTPLNSIKGFAQILKYDESITKEQKDEYLDIIINESTRLATLSTNVLNLSKIENQVILTDIENFNIGENVRESLLLFQNQLQEKNLELDVDIVDFNIDANKSQLSQVWVNLIDNAIKFSEYNTTLTIKVLQQEKAIIIIENEGEGIESSKIGKIFQRFYQSDESHTAKGHGIGLAIVEKIIQLHNGTIICTSTIGQKTRFTVELPIK